jgi:hypothetical protein
VVGACGYGLVCGVMVGSLISAAVKLRMRWEGKGGESVVHWTWVDVCRVWVGRAVSHTVLKDLDRQ